MTAVTTGLIISTTCLVLFSLLFGYEGKRGVRFLGTFRAYADLVVLRMFRMMHDVFRFIGRDFIRQLFHYLFHRVLRVSLSVIRRCEEALRNAIRVNKTLAQNVEKERETKTKLEEIAYHKATTALTEEEKKKHRDKMLEGF